MVRIRMIIIVYIRLKLFVPTWFTVDRFPHNVISYLRNASKFRNDLLLFVIVRVSNEEIHFFRQMRCLNGRCICQSDRDKQNTFTSTKIEGDNIQTKNEAIFISQLNAINQIKSHYFFATRHETWH